MSSDVGQEKMYLGLCVLSLIHSGKLVGGSRNKLSVQQTRNSFLHELLHIGGIQMSIVVPIGILCQRCLFTMCCFDSQPPILAVAFFHHAAIFLYFIVLKLLVGIDLLEQSATHLSVLIKHLRYTISLLHEILVGQCWPLLHHLACVVCSMLAIAASNTAQQHLGFYHGPWPYIICSAPLDSFFLQPRSYVFARASSSLLSKLKRLTYLIHHPILSTLNIFSYQRVLLHKSLVVISCRHPHHDTDFTAFNVPKSSQNQRRP